MRSVSILAMALVLIGVAAPSRAAVYLEARDAAAGVRIPAPATYHVWLWGPARARAEATLGDGPALGARPQEDAKGSGFGWVRAGEAPLEAGPLAVALGERTAAIALSTDPDFHPAALHADTRARLAPDMAWQDERPRAQRHTDTVFTMPRHADADHWRREADRLRRRILLSSGLWEMGVKTPLNARVFDRVERDGYSVEKVHFEAWPGYLVTGNLYRPLGEGPFPGILHPHGHWQHGRLEDSDKCSVAARCITLARMGAVSFTYDMVGYNDSRQLGHTWGNNEQKLWGLHPFGIQLWSAVRALDFLETLPDVDPGRLGCTGASGGGTQTFALMAVDPRVKAAAPVNMISSTMQGGCVCENAPLIRLDHSNMEIGALMAPRPLLLVSATGDWTRETPRVEFPAIRGVYERLGAPDLVENVHIDAGHNYNQASREAMYRFFATHLLGVSAPESEPPHAKEPDEALRVFPGEGPLEGRPGPDEILENIRRTQRDNWRRVATTHPDQIRPELLSDLTGAEPVDPNALRMARTGIDRRADHTLERWVIGRKDAGDAVPALLYRGADTDATPQDAVLLVHGGGKAALADPAGGPGARVRELIAAGKAVLLIDAYLTGEHHSPYAETKAQEGAFHDTFLRTTTAERIQDVLTVLAFLRARRDTTDRIGVEGIGDGGVWCLFAAAIDGNVARVVVDAAGFDAEDDAAWAARFYLPGVRAVGGLDAPLRLLGDRVEVRNAGGLRGWRPVAADGA